MVGSKLHVSSLLFVVASTVFVVPALGSVDHECRHDNADDGPAGPADHAEYDNHPWANAHRTPVLGFGVQGDVSGETVADQQVGGVGVGADGGGEASVESRRLQSSQQSIRILADYSNLVTGVDLSTELKNFVQETLVPEATRYWEEALSVTRVSAPLHASRGCLVYNTAGTCRTFQTRAACGHESIDYYPTIPSDYLATEQECTANGVCTTLPGGAGAPNTDFVVLVSAVKTTACDSNLVAEAAWCRTDTYDRPLWARLNLCPNRLSSAAAELEEQKNVVIHELAHALGFTSRSLPLFREASNGTPRTPRSDAPVAIHRVADEYVHSVPCEGSTREVAVPATSTLSFFSGRGLGAEGCTPYDTPSMCIAKVVTPAVAKMSKLFFGCDTVDGAELENQPTSSCKPFGSHWETRVFTYSLMAATQSAGSYISPLTLAWFEDSGWYNVSYDAASSLQFGVASGYQQGCSFANDRCLNVNEESLGSPPHFCSAAEDSCTLNRVAKAQCSRATYASPIPAPYRYFDSEQKGGTPSQADYCPYFKKVSGGECYLPLDGDNFHGSTRGQGSRCMASTLSRSVNGVDGDPIDTACYKTTCLSGNSLELEVQLDETTTEKVECISADQEFEFLGFAGALSCPDPAVLCGPGQKVKPFHADVPGNVSFATSSLVVSRPSTAAEEVVVNVAVTRLAGASGATTAMVTASGDAVDGTDYTLPSDLTLSWASMDMQTKHVALVVKHGAAAAETILSLLLTGDRVSAGGSQLQVTFAPTPVSAGTSRSTNLVLGFVSFVVVGIARNAM